MLQKPRAARVSPKMPDLSRFHQLADELVRLNQDLMEENRQIRAAFALWAKVGSEICASCSRERQRVQVEDGRFKDRPTDFVELGDSLLRSLGPVFTSSPAEAPVHPDFQRWREAAESSEAPAEPSPRRPIGKKDRRKSSAA